MILFSASVVVGVIVRQSAAGVLMSADPLKVAAPDTDMVPVAVKFVQPANVANILNLFVAFCCHQFLSRSVVVQLLVELLLHPLIFSLQQSFPKCC